PVFTTRSFSSLSHIFSLYSILPHPPQCPLFPYTTLFRSGDALQSMPARAMRRRLPDRGDVPTHRRYRRFRQVHLHRLQGVHGRLDRKSTRLNSSHEWMSYAVFCLEKIISDSHPVVLSLY